MPISISWKGLNEAQRDLQTMAKRAVPYAARNALNTIAFEARAQWQREIRGAFTLRNRFTERSVLVTKASGTDIKRMASFVGSTAPFMADQEHGGLVRGRHGLKGIPGPAAAGQQPGGARTRLVRAANRLGAINVSHPQLKGSRKQRNAIALAVARRKGQTVALLERPKGGKGLFNLMGGKRRIRTRLLWDFSKRAVRVSSAPTLQRTLSAVSRKIPHILMASTLEQLKRARILGY
jgi:hypothetical protein